MRKTSSVLFGLGVLLAALAFLSPASAQQDKRPPVRDPLEFIPPQGQTMRVGLEILVDGKPLPTVYYHGKTYLPVPRWGTEYAIRVTNSGPRRIAAILSVDGLSVINGQPASENNSGYLVTAHGNVVIKGWRRNMDTVAAFSFEERNQSYASKIGRPANIGVIGLIAIEEQAAPPRPLLEKRADSAAGAQRAFGEAGGTGTGYGRDVDSPVYYVPFVRSANKQTITFYYDTVEALRGAGVPVDRPDPVPFPRDGEFVPPPPGDPRK